MIRAFRRVCPARPTTSCFLPSKSIAENRTMRSETFFVEEEVMAVVVVAVERDIRDFEKKEREGRRCT